MKPFALITLSWFACMAAALAVCVAVFGRPEARLPVEVLKLPRTSFRDEALRAIFDSRNLAKAGKPLLLILGASATQEGYPPSALQPLLPDFSVNNLAIGAANVTEMDQALDLALKSARPAGLQGSELVLGLSYPVFVRDGRRWTHPDIVGADMVRRGEVVSDIVKEATRCPPLLDPGNPVFRLTPAPLSEWARGTLAALLPLLSHLTVHPADPVLAWPHWRHHPLVPVAAVAPAPPPPPPESHVDARKQMDWLTDYMGEEGHRLPEEQFAVLRRLVGKARRAGMRVTAVNLPLPSWHQTDSPYHAAYWTALQHTLRELSADPGVRLIDLSSSAPDTWFRDSSHPAKEAVQDWSAALARSISQPW